MPAGTHSREQLCAIEPLAQICRVQGFLLAIHVQHKEETGAVVLENTVCKPSYLYAGVPAKTIKPVSEA